MDKPAADDISEEEKNRLLKYIERYREQGLDSKQHVELYDETSAEYEKIYQVMNYVAPQETARTMGEVFPDNREKVKILDVAAGTGLVGVELVKLGFKDMDALDPSQGMLNEAKKKNVYNNLICEYLGENKLPIKERIYDAVTMSGWLAETQAFFDELISVIKPGGVFVNVSRSVCHHFHEGYKKDESKWKLESRRLIPEYSTNSEGSAYVYRIF